MSRTRVRTPQEDDIRLLDFAVGARASTRAEYCRQTDDARCVYVRLQLSMLLVPNATRASFCARKFTSFVDFEHEKMPSAFGPCASRLRWNPAAARSSASSQAAGRSTPPSRTSGCVSRA